MVNNIVLYHINIGVCLLVGAAVVLFFVYYIRPKRSEGMSSKSLLLLSKNKPVFVYPEWNAFPGSNLVDGDLNTFTQSAFWIANKNAYAEIDLGKKYRIKKVIIYNRLDCLRELPFKLHHQLPHITNETSFTVNHFTPNVIDCNRFGVHKLFIDDVEIGSADAKGAKFVIYDNLAVEGRKVKVQMNGVLALSAIEVYGLDFK